MIKEFAFVSIDELQAQVRVRVKSLGISSHLDYAVGYKRAGHFETEGKGRRDGYLHNAEHVSRRVPLSTRFPRCI